MHLQIANNKFCFDNTPVGVERSFQKIDEVLSASSLYMSHLVVDGTDVIENHYDYLLEHMEEVQEVEVKVLTPQEQLFQVWWVLDNYLSQVVPETLQLAGEFYQKPDDSTWQRFITVMGGVQKLIDIITAMMADHTLANETEVVNLLARNFQDELETLKGAVERQDMTLVADILRHELVPFMEKLHREVEGMLSGGSVHDYN